jgi:hypothetical protein
MAPMVVAATLLPLLDGCGGETDLDPSAGGTGGTGTQVGGQGGRQNTGGAGGLSAGGTTSTGGVAPVCPPGYMLQEWVVPVPAGSTPADLATVCGWGGAFSSATPAARVTLQANPSTPTHATGLITISSEVVAPAGYLTVAALDVGAGGVVSGLTRTAAGWEFAVDWPSAPYLGESLAATVTLELACLPSMSSTRRFQTSTNLALCGSDQSRVWTSSGDTCRTCYYPMAEMAAMPLPARPTVPDGLPLPGELDISIQAVASNGRVVVLRAESPSASGDLRYDWRVSGGELLLAAADLAIWTLPDQAGPHQAQVAAETEQCASIATYLYQDDA